MTILVTGATGIAGRHILQALEQRGVPVLGVSRRPAAGGHSADISEPLSIERLPDFAGVVHCAGLTPRVGTATWADFQRTNVDGTVLLATEAAKRGAAFFVYLSTGGRLGRRRSASPTRLYVVSKYLAERRTRQILQGRVPALSLRAASLYGEYDDGSMSRLIRAIAHGRFVLPVRGAVTKCLLYAGTLAEVVAEEIGSQSVRGWRARAIADERSYTLAEIVAVIERVVGRRTFRVAISPRLMSLAIRPAEVAGGMLGGRRLMELAHGARTALTPVECRSDNLLEEHHGERVALEEGVRREVEWLRANRLL